jgi:LmbE family N-acetylglucosaminyl deacetylase
MATLVTFHAHPDDESIQTGGTMAKAKAEGHRVVLVIATRGEEGEIRPDVLADGEPLADRRVDETHRAAGVLGVDRVEFLGYLDSGMMGEPTNDAEGCFWQADLDEAAERLARILREEETDVLLVYDEIGGYGHPDHIQVHRVGHRAGELAGVPRVLEVTINRDALIQGMRERAEAGDLPDGLEVPDIENTENFGMPEERITHRVDVSEYATLKRDALFHHETQVGPEHFFLAMPDDMFLYAFGQEWFIDRSAPRAPGEPFKTDLFEGL